MAEKEDIEHLAFSPKVNEYLLGSLCYVIDQQKESTPQFRQSFVSQLVHSLLMVREQDPSLSAEDYGHIKHIVQIFQNFLERHGESFSEDVSVHTVQ